MPGSGFKTFNTGDILTAADVNGYLMKQAVMYFATATARSTALTAPEEGMVTYLADSNSLQYYDGAAWQPLVDQDVIAAKGDLIVGTGDDTVSRLAVGANDTRLVADSSTATGLKYVADTVNTVIDAKGDLLAGTAADTVGRLPVGTNGQILIADSTTGTGLRWGAASTGGALVQISSQSITAQTTVTFDNVFTSTYRNYKIIFTFNRVASGNLGLFMRLRTSGADNTNSTYNFQYIDGSSTTVSGGRTASANYARVSEVATVLQSSAEMLITTPQLSQETSWLCSTAYAVTANTAPSIIFYGGNFNNTTSFDGVKFYLEGGTATFTGTITIYGVTN